MPTLSLEDAAHRERIIAKRKGCTARAKELQVAWRVRRAVDQAKSLRGMVAAEKADGA